MHSQQKWVAPVALVTLFFYAGDANADSVRLTNGDIIRGEVVSLGEQELTIKSENFGEMTIPRDKVELIALGDKSIEEMLRSTSGQQPAQQSGTSAMPSMQNPQVQQQLNRLMQEALGGGFGGIGTMQQDLQETERGLRELQQDLGPGSTADALDGYIKLFQLFGGGAGAGDGEASVTPPGQTAPQP